MYAFKEEYLLPDISDEGNLTLDSGASAAVGQTVSRVIYFCSANEDGVIHNADECFGETLAVNLYCKYKDFILSVLKG